MKTEDEILYEIGIHLNTIKELDMEIDDRVTIRKKVLSMIEALEWAVETVK